VARLRRRDNALLSCVLLIIAVTALGQAPSNTGFQIQGVVISNKLPIPGVVIVATNSERGNPVTTITGTDGRYELKLPSAGRYRVSAQITAFAPDSKNVDVTDSSKPARADFELTLVSRAQRTQQPEQPTVPTVGAETPETLTSALGAPSTDGVPAGQIEPTSPGMSVDAPTESVAVTGNTAAPAFGGMFDENRRPPGEFNGDFAGFGRGGGEDNRGARGGFGGFGGRGGRGGRGDGGGFVLGGQRARRNINKPQVNLSYTLGDSVFDAAPFALNGAPPVKPQYAQNRFTGTIGGPFVIPKLVNASQNTFYNLSYNGSLVRNPIDTFSTVPTAAERSGDFSQRAVVLRDPRSGVPFAGNRVPSSLFNAASVGLLQYVPLPNQPGLTQNFHYVTTNESNGNDVNFRLIRTFGAVQPGQRGGGRGGFGGFGGRGGGPGRRGQTTLSVGLQFHSVNNTANSTFPSVGGLTTTRSFNIPVNFTRTFGPLLSITTVSYNRNRVTATNLFSSKQDVAGALGISGVSRDPLEWGLPTLTFTNYSSLIDVRPSLRSNQLYRFSESLGWFHGKHNVRFGGDFRHSRLDSHAGTNARGTFTFNGAVTGFDFADFLLGFPQLTSVQYGTNNYRFLGDSYDLYIQDDWRPLGKLTINTGLRYEFTGPLTEANNRLVNLDIAPSFSAVVPVLPGQAGPFTGVFPRGLVNPDRNNWAPSVGIAWRPLERTIVRAGYGIAYNSAVYASMVQQFAFQPPFSVTQTNIASPLVPLTLQDGFPAPSGATVTNNFGVNRNYRVGYAQTWNLSIQRELPKSLTLTADYTGTKGTRLDILQAPNRTATGLRIPGVQPFTWESSTGDSIAHTGRLQVRRRLQSGISVGANFTWSKSIDNASSFGAASGNIAQDASNLAAERAVSNFDQPYRLNGDYVWQLPFGQNRRWLSANSTLGRWFGDWQLSGTYNIASSTPFTARVIGDVSDIRRGTNGTLRANATGLPVSLSDPNVALWFNTAAFVLPAPGTYGNAGRNTIRGPLTHQFDMSLNKTVAVSNDRIIDFRIQATNVFNTPQYRVIDTTVNSPSFGRVISAGSMRKIQLVARYRF